MTDAEKKILKERFERYDHLCDLYNSNKEFKAFVDKTCKNYGLHKDICLLHKTVQEVADYYEHKDDGILDQPKCCCELEPEDKSC